MESRHRAELERIRQDHSKNVDQSELKHSQKRKTFEEDKQVITQDKQSALEEAKKKLTQLNQIDLENRELQYVKNLDN